jgi:hypothetical protein
MGIFELIKERKSCWVSIPFQGILLLSGIVMATRFLAGPWIIDDAYITFRYARNAADGLGLVYNLDQYVLGTSSPLFALLLSLVYQVSHWEIPWIALGINSLADGFSVFLLYKMAQRLSTPYWAVYLCALCWAFYPLTIRYTLSGMETSLANALILGTFVLFVYHHFYAAIILATLAILTRPDASVVLVLLLVSQVIQAPGQVWKSFLIILAILFPWLLFATIYYGNPIPQSIWAKSHQIYLVHPYSNFFQIFYNFSGIFINSLFGLSAEGITFTPPANLFLPLRLIGALQLFLWILGVRTAVVQNKRYGYVFLFPILFCLAYGLVGLKGKAMAEWYFVPLAPYYFLGILLGLSKISTASRTRRIVPITAFVILTAIQISGLNIGRLPDRNLWVPPAVSIARENLYRSVALKIKEKIQPAAVIATPEIGTLGYYSGCTILDTAGLISPEALSYYPLPRHMYYINSAIPPNLIRNSKPNYLISLDAFMKNSLIREAWFFKEYRLEGQIPTGIFGSQFLQIYKRQ